ncbi:hypothetical protein [Streptomyces cavernae]|uniref:hypothetical protein n=1 Tax=Streptomyces cavernae TaxID=2259034 RepID=UPI0012D956F7|nr:hypothetical protein [Streptomyces cavernae]
MFTFVGAAALVVLTACGGGDGGGGSDADKSGQGDVASINTPAAGGGSTQSSADPDAGRPRIRLDTTQEEINRMMDAWLACLKENGAEKKYKTSPNAPEVKACRGKEPLDPPELDPAKNPDYSDDVRIMVKCMNEHGIKSVVVDGGWGLEEGASLSAPNYEEAEATCQVKAFGEDD